MHGAAISFRTPWPLPAQRRKIAPLRSGQASRLASALAQPRGEEAATGHPWGQRAALLCDGPYLRALPPRVPVGGFFAARLRKG